MFVTFEMGLSDKLQGQSSGACRGPNTLSFLGPPG